MPDDIQTPVVPETPAASVAEPSGWAGELATLDKEEWYSKLDEPVRKTVRSGYEARLKNYEKGVQAKVTSTNAEKKALEERVAKAERNARLYEVLNSGEDDPRLSEYEAKIKDAEARLAEHEAKYGEATAERDSYKTRWEEHEAKQREAEAAVIFDKHKDIMDDDAAFAKFSRLLQAEMDPEEAAAVVHALYPGLGDKAVPKDVALMSKGDGTPNHLPLVDKTLTFREKLERQAEKNWNLHNGSGN
jgi:hypothetical protein